VGIEMLMTALAPRENREATGRIDSVDVLMKTSGANEISKNKSNNEYILNCTHEDMITPIVKSYVNSYKDLPVTVYQIQNKFRNEARAKSGIMR
jgi:prolyl-tRNA synthetase